VLLECVSDDLSLVFMRDFCCYVYSLDQFVWQPEIELSRSHTDVRCKHMHPQIYISYPFLPLYSAIPKHSNSLPGNILRVVELPKQPK